MSLNGIQWQAQLFQSSTGRGKYMYMNLEGGVNVRDLVRMMPIFTPQSSWAMNGLGFDCWVGLAVAPPSPDDMCY